MTTAPFKRRLDRIEASIAQMEPERPRRILSAEESAELARLEQGDPFDLPRDQFFRWKNLHFLRGYGGDVGEIYKRRPTGGRLATAMKKKEMVP